MRIIGLLMALFVYAYSRLDYNHRTVGIFLILDCDSSEKAEIIEAFCGSLGFFTKNQIKKDYKQKQAWPIQLAYNYPWKLQNIRPRHMRTP